MPIGAIKGKGSEKSWERAKGIAREQYPGLKDRDSSKFYSIVMIIYKNICKNKDCTPKNEAGISIILDRIEESSPTEENLTKSYEKWFLYEPVSGSKKKTMDAVLKLDEAMSKARVSLHGFVQRNRGLRLSENGDKEIIGGFLSKVWDRLIKPVLNDNTFEEVGIKEPEVGHKAAQELVNFVKVRYGVYQFTDLGDYIN